MLALYHLFSGTPAKDFPQGAPRTDCRESCNPDLGARTSSGSRWSVPAHLKAGLIIKDDGTEVRTLWANSPGSWVAARPTT